MEQPDFTARRRQPFLSEQALIATLERASRTAKAVEDQWKRPGNDADDFRRLSWVLADDSFTHWVLRYTGGASLGELRNDLPSVVEAYERYTKYLRAYEEDDEYSPLGLDLLADYERALQLISLCYLLGCRDLLPRVAAMLDGYAACDTLFEELLSFELEGRFDVDQWYHNKPYRLLIESLYCDSKEESIADIKTYLEAWYPAMEGTPWHDTHLTMTEQGGAYFGYWAFEAGAIVYLLGLDDTSFRDNIVYPKDLVDYARQHFPLDQEQRPTQYRVLPGERCPKTGEWMVGHTPKTRRHFNEGDIMPELHLANGATIWMFAPGQR